MPERSEQVLRDVLGQSLDAPCQYCEGHGSYWQWKLAGPAGAEQYACPHCAGKGFTLTAHGEALLAFIRRHL